jgi:integrase
VSKPARNEQGITVRHARNCGARTGGRCTCTPTFQAQAWDARTNTRPTKTFKTITAARQWRQDAGSALRRGEMSGARGPKLNDAAAELLAAMRAGTALTPKGHPYKPSVIRSYECTLNLRVLPAWGNHRLGDIDLVDLQRWIDRLAAQEIAASTVCSAVMPLRTIYRRANRMGIVPKHNPTRGLALPALPGGRERFATPIEAEQVIAALALPERAAWATALYAGLRRGELAALRREDVDLANGVIHVHRSWDPVEGEIETKGRRRRRVAIPGELRDHLLDQLAHAGQRLLVLPGRQRARGALLADRRRAAHQLRAEGMTLVAIAERFGVSHATITNDLRQLPDATLSRTHGPAERIFTRDEKITTVIERAHRALRAAGLEPLGLHECRHSYASFLIAAGANAKAISAMMGHASINITIDRYGHLMPGAENEVATLLDAYLQAARADSPDIAELTELAELPDA